MSDVDSGVGKKIEPTRARIINLDWKMNPTPYSRRTQDSRRILHHSSHLESHGRRFIGELVKTAHKLESSRKSCTNRLRPKCQQMEQLLERSDWKDVSGRAKRIPRSTIRSQRGSRLRTLWRMAELVLQLLSYGHFHEEEHRGVERGFEWHKCIM